MVKFLGTLFGKPADEPAEMEVMTPVITLNPATVVGASPIQSLELAAEQAAGEYDPKKSVRTPIKALAKLVNDLYGEYRDYGLGVLDTAAAAFRQCQTNYDNTKTAANTAEMDGLRAQAQTILTRKADRQIEVRNRMKRLSTEIRKLTIGIVGDPDREVKAPSLMMWFGVPAAVLTATFVLEFMLNFDVVRFASDRNVSTAFSIVVSLAGLGFALMAAKAERTKTTYKNAQVALARRFGQGGYDRETKSVAMLLPLDTGLPAMSTFSHVALIGLVTIVLLFRLYVIGTESEPNLGSLAGTLAFAFCVAALYAFERWWMPGIEHPRLRELLDKQDELADLKEEDTLLSSEAEVDEFREELAGLVAEHNKGFADRARASESAARALATSHQDFRRMWGEVVGAESWFRDLTYQVCGNFFSWLGNFHPELAESPDYQPSPELFDKLGVKFRPAALPNYSDVLDFDLPIGDATAGSLSAASLTEELWPDILAAAEAEAKRRDEEEHKHERETATGFVPPRITLAGVVRR